MPRIIFHIDVNSAFVSWLGVKLVKEGKPDIRLVPSVVSGETGHTRPGTGLNGAQKVPRPYNHARGLGVVQAVLGGLYRHLPELFAHPAAVLN